MHHAPKYVSRCASAMDPDIFVLLDGMMSQASHEKTLAAFVDLDALFGEPTPAIIDSEPEREDRVEPESLPKETRSPRVRSVGDMRSMGSSEISGSVIEPQTNVPTPLEGPIHDWDDEIEERRARERAKTAGVFAKLFSNKPMHGYASVAKSAEITNSYDAVLFEEKECLDLKFSTEASKPVRSLGESRRSSAPASAGVKEFFSGLSAAFAKPKPVVSRSGSVRIPPRSTSMFGGAFGKK